MPSRDGDRSKLPGVRRRLNPPIAAGLRSGGVYQPRLGPELSSRLSAVGLHLFQK
jgi:hypothetical protein